MNTTLIQKAADLIVDELTRQRLSATQNLTLLQTILTYRTGALAASRQSGKTTYLVDLANKVAGNNSTSNQPQPKHVLVIGHYQLELSEHYSDMTNVDTTTIDELDGLLKNTDHRYSAVLFDEVLDQTSIVSTIEQLCAANILTNDAFGFAIGTMC